MARVLAPQGLASVAACCEEILMTKEVGCVRRATSALMLCISVILGSLILATPSVSAQVDDAAFDGAVTIESVPAPDTLVMYSVGSGGTPVGNSTVTGMTGDYEIWVEGAESVHSILRQWPRDVRR